MTPEDTGSFGRLVDDVRRFGMDAAAGIAGRFARMVAPLDQGTSGPPFADGRSGRLASDVLDAMTATMRVLQDVADIAGNLVTDGAGPDGRERLTVKVAAAGGSGAADLWLHNTSSTAVSAITFTAVDLVGSGGRVPAAALSFEPDTIDELPPGSSRRVTVAVTVPAAAEPGMYHGLVVASAPPGVTMPIRVDVDGAGDP
ncbi:MAG: DUF4232 domain-containing protein [Actinomycetota bacterium]|nr:DUF4232 domain-containing protein [Actinomycetota bacterium]